MQLWHQFQSQGEGNLSYHNWQQSTSWACQRLFVVSVFISKRLGKPKLLLLNFKSLKTYDFPSHKKQFCKPWYGSLYWFHCNRFNTEKTKPKAIGANVLVQVRIQSIFTTSKQVRGSQSKWVTKHFPLAWDILVPHQAALYFRIFLFFFFGLPVCGILIPPPGVEPVPLALEGQSPNHWTTRKFPTSEFLKWQKTFKR